MAQSPGVWADRRARIFALCAPLLVSVPLLVAIAAAVLGYRELSDSLTLPVRGVHALTLRSDALELLVAEDGAVRRYAATKRRAALDPYFADRPQTTAALGTLPALLTDIRVETGPLIAADLLALHERWLATVAQPIVDGPATAAARAALRRDGPLVARFRAQTRALGVAIREHIVDHQQSGSKELGRIAVLFFASITMCAVGIFAGAWQLMNAGRARRRAETVLREREMLHERDRAWSRSFARAVLPPALPVVNGCRFDAVYEPGENDRQVGGDWYDAVRLVDGRILISIGDVAGSGVEAAVVMGVARQIMRGIAQVRADPALMLDAADRALRLEHGDVFATAWVGVIDLVTRRLSFSSAGHPPALLASTDGGLRELGDSALPLGLRQGHQGRTTAIELDDVSTIVLYTDGLSEATHDVIAGEARVRLAVNDVAARPWHEPAGWIKRRVLTDGSLDDVAILVARVDLREAERFIRRLTVDVRDPSAARSARAVLRDLLAARGVQPAESANAELVLAELIGNVVRHAAGRPEMDIAIDCGGPQTVLHVFDGGPGFRHSSRVPADVFAESGRGLFIIAALTEEFTVSRRETGGSHARATLVGGSVTPLVCSATAREFAREPGTLQIEPQPAGAWRSGVVRSAYRESSDYGS